LIRSALNASANTGRKIKVLAVEKNPNAIVTLSCMIRDMWHDKDVNLIAKDMRYVQLEEKADIMVSELLGSFGDNELSPECIDGVQHHLKPDGISIPCDSVSYLQPVMSKKLFYSFHQEKKEKRERYGIAAEINWLSYMSRIFHIDNFQELFKFVHPNLEQKPIDNSRHGCVTFRSSLDCVLNGFAGYFTSKLYKDIELSILPTTHTLGMASWYPIFFPVATPIEIKKDEEIEVEFWRKGDKEKVWYEYVVNKPAKSIIHNKNGDIHPILL
jgi:protein arginine N-methyltransferase 5